MAGGQTARQVASAAGPESAEGLLRFIACGGVDDGKSTLLGRLLYESRNIATDHLSALTEDSKRIGTRDGAIDFALLLDGLSAEREQGITTDVAYRYFSTPRRRYVIADTPGHEQYTRNMASGASTADVAIVVVDARKGVLTQTRRHTYIVSLLGIRHVVLAVNKMDLVGYSQTVFAQTEDAYRAFTRRLQLEAVTCIPLTAVHGDNILAPRGNMPWHRGPTLMAYLESVALGEGSRSRSFRMPVQCVNRPNLEFRGFAGTIVSGEVAPGDRVRVHPSGASTRIARIVSGAGDLLRAAAGESIVLTFSDEIDVSRGDVVAAADDPLPVADQFEATLLWMDDAPMLRGRSYLMKQGTVTVNATIAPLKYKVNVDTLEHLAADKLELNEIGVCVLELDRKIAFEPYSVSRDLGGFILIDRLTNNTVGAGQLRFALRRSQNIHRQAFDIDRSVRASQKGQRPGVLWLTGLSGAGKSTIANQVERKLHALGRHTYLLDGDNVRKGLNKDLGFTDADRVENIRRIAEVAALLVDAGLIVITAFISPFRAERDMARGLFASGEFVEIFVDTPLAVAEARDTKGLYARARRGELRNFTGIDSAYEPPERAEIVIDGANVAPADAARRIVDELVRRGMLGG